MAGIWDQLVDAICRPPRDVYNPGELLGGSSHAFAVGNMEASRIDYELRNKAGQQIMVSHYLPINARTRDDKLPVVVYCHCNSGSRRDAEEAVWHLLPCGVGVVAFDFTGSGLSDGKWVTLGAREVDDLAVVVDHLRTQGGVSSIALWGRSMGAVTALLYSARDPDIAGMVLDSPFSRLTDLMLEIVVSQRLPIPKVMLKLALKLMRASVKRKAGADISAVSPLDVVGGSLIPAMFGHGREDSFIAMHHSEKLHDAYNSSAAYPVYKNIVRFDGDHNHPRPAFFYSSVCCFFHQQLKLDQVLLPGRMADTQQLLRHGSLDLSGEAPGQVDRANGFINTPWSFEGVTSLDDLAPEDRQAAAAALLLDDSAAATAAEHGEAPAGGGGLGSPTARLRSGSGSSSSGAGGKEGGLQRLTGTAAAATAAMCAAVALVLRCLLQLAAVLLLMVLVALGLLVQQSAAAAAAAATAVEEEMLQRAIALSLAAMQQQQQQEQEPHGQPDTGLAPLPLLQGQPPAEPLQLLQEQQSEQASHLLVSRCSLDGDGDDELSLGGLGVVQTAAAGAAADDEQRQSQRDPLLMLPALREQQQQQRQHVAQAGQGQQQLATQQREQQQQPRVHNV
ncbi:Alpha/Beta hydrolase protein [Scenedesmus sp. NREL 46B-D3]|nr:Alpha/Beta hydrolase protein [Scenedesmus sp. NREL 46B-D3]